MCPETSTSEDSGARPEPIVLSVLDEVTWCGKRVPGSRTRALLRALVAAGPRGLSDDALIDEIWSMQGQPVPANPARALQVVVSRARDSTRGQVVERTSQGYRLALAPDQVDAWALRPEGLRLAAEGRYAEALPLLGRADQDDEVLAALLRTEAENRAPPLPQHDGAYREVLADSLAGFGASRKIKLARLADMVPDLPIFLE